MTAPIPIVSVTGYSFPDVTIAVDDMLRWPYRVDGRDARGIDCLGVVIEVYRRCGIGVPDPLTLADGIEEFRDYFVQVEQPSIYDVAYLNRPSHHIGIVIDQEYVLTATETALVHRDRLSLVKRIPSIEYYALRTELIASP